MDLQTRKIVFVQEFLKLQSEDIIAKLEKMLSKEKKEETNSSLKPFSEEQLNERVALSEVDFENNRFKPSAELITKFEKML